MWSIRLLLQLVEVGLPQLLRGRLILHELRPINSELSCPTQRDPRAHRNLSLILKPKALGPSAQVLLARAHDLRPSSSPFTPD